MQIWPHSRMDWKKEIKRRGCVVLTHPLIVLKPISYHMDSCMTC